MMTALLFLANGFVAQENRPFTDAFDEDEKDFVTMGRNPYFVLEPGYFLELEGTEKGKKVELVITVLGETKNVAGVETRVVEEREFLGSELVEVSRNYFAISKRTNGVYYFGEDVDLYKDGKVAGHDGSWLAGEKGARWGLMMPGVPLLGARHFQEIAHDVAMDRAEIVALDQTIDTPAGKYEHVLKVEETTPLEKSERSHKYYAKGIGLVCDGNAKLVMCGKKR